MLQAYLCNFQSFPFEPWKLDFDELVHKGALAMSGNYVFLERHGLKEVDPVGSPVLYCAEKGSPTDLHWRLPWDRGIFSLYSRVSLRGPNRAFQICPRKIASANPRSLCMADWPWWWWWWVRIWNKCWISAPPTDPTSLPIGLHSLCPSLPSSCLPWCPVPAELSQSYLQADCEQTGQCVSLCQPKLQLNGADMPYTTSVTLFGQHKWHAPA